MEEAQIVPKWGGRKTRFEIPPFTPNCVSSRAVPRDYEHIIAPYIVPIDIRTESEALKVIVTTIETLPNAQQWLLVEKDAGYLQYIFTSGIMKFKDDVQFECDIDSAGSNIVHIRSASRVGYGDMGANRKRLEELRTYLGWK